MPRKLASVQKIREIVPIEGADRIERVGILLWYCVAKKGEFKPGDLCVYFEIDSLLPEWSEFEFLRKSSWNEKLQRYRLKSAKLRGALSQGLAIPLELFADRIEAAGLGPINRLEEGTDLTDALDVEKYEPPIPVSMSGKARPFTWPIAKSDEVRLESEPELLDRLAGKSWYITAKLDGTSGSFILDPPGDSGNGSGEATFHVCSRNYSLEEDPENIFWIVTNKYAIEKSLRDYHAATGRFVAVQGEVCGPGIQGNKLGLEAVELFVFNVVDVETRELFPLDRLREFCAGHGLTMVPTLEEGDSASFTTEDLFAKSEFLYRDLFAGARKDQEAEGIVVRAKDQSVSFKKLNNRYLLSGGE
jgi:RNA ligase (TIGR02306 family)